MFEAFGGKIEFRSIRGLERWRPGSRDHGSNARDRHACRKARGFEGARALRRNGRQNFVVVAACQDGSHRIGVICGDGAGSLRKRDCRSPDLGRNPRRLAHAGEIQRQPVGYIHRA